MANDLQLTIKRTASIASGSVGTDNRLKIVTYAHTKNIGLAKQHLEQTAKYITHSPALSLI